jgi:NMD protein affecting ribosome stability and mRNA decay
MIMETHAAGVVTRQCAEGLHGYCPGDGASCGCAHCHLGPCPACGAENLRKLYDGLCAGCYRTRAYAAPATTTACDNCGASPAYRNPVHRRNEYLCTACHAAAGETLRLAPSVQGLVASCRGADVSDPAHEWAHVRGNTFGCLRCKTKSWQPGLRKATRRRELGGTR